MTKCGELVVVDVDFQWSDVYVNHGAAEFVGRRLLRKDVLVHESQHHESVKQCAAVMRF